MRSPQPNYQSNPFANAAQSDITGIKLSLPGFALKQVSSPTLNLSSLLLVEVGVVSVHSVLVYFRDHRDAAPGAFAWGIPSSHMPSIKSL
jgi:hypothetical protein